MILKTALQNVQPIEAFEYSSKGASPMIRTASSSRLVLEPDSDKAKVVEAEIKKHPNALFFRAKAIEANSPNTNGDYFSEDELKRACHSFVGVPFFTNHENQDIEKAKGKIIHAEWDDKEKAIYTIAFVDRDAYPHIARSIEEEYASGVSMGCSVEYSVCNICGNKAERTDDYCSHIKNRKGRKFSGTARDVNTGELKTFKDQEVFEYNYGIKFIELSAVVDPACPTCHINGIIKNEDYLKKVANIQNDLYMIKTAAIEKKAGQEEIQQLESVLDTLENMAVQLIQQRKQVEPEFASDLVQIITDLQSWVDELVAAGYGNLESQVPGTVGDLPEEGMGQDMGQGLDSSMNAQAQPMPVSEETPMDQQEVGQTSGDVSNPMVKSPSLPISTPLRPNASHDEKITKISNFESIQQHGKNIIKKLADISENISKKGDIDMGKRRTLSAKRQEKDKAMEVLSNSWKEKQEFFEYIKEVPSIQDNNNRLSVKKKDDTFIIVAESKEMPSDNMVWSYEDLNREQKDMIRQHPKDAAKNLLETFAESKNHKEGVKNMTDINREAGASSVNKNPEVVTEKQLEEQGLYHSRTGVEQDVITQKQLDSGQGASPRTGTEADVITQKQLDGNIRLNPRQNDERDVITQKQLDSGNGAMPRTGYEQDVITQKQLDERRTGNEQDVITEKQLDSIDSAWERFANRDASKFRSAKSHMEDVIEIAANAVLASGATPDEICDVASNLVASTDARIKLAKSIAKNPSDEDVDFAKRVSYWANKNFKIASAGKAAIADILIDGLRKSASDETTNPDVLISAVDVLGEGEDAVKAIIDKVDEKLVQAATVSKKSSVKDELRKVLSASKEKEQREKERLDVLASVTSKESKKKEGTEGNAEVSGKQKRDAERAKWLGKVSSKADTIIETSFDEVGMKKDDPNFKKGLVSFAKGALASNEMKLAAITNVTISGDTIQIAVQTDDGSQAVNIPIGQSTEPSDEEVIPEADLTGEGFENFASTKKKMTKKAQVPSGAGIPQDPMGQGSPESGLPGGEPSNDPIQALTTGVEGDEDDSEIPSDNEKQMPWAICPECGSSDVDITVGEDGTIKGKCNNCGAEYEALVKKNIEFKIVKPGNGKSLGAEGEEMETEIPEVPEVPAMPVAAQTRLDKKTITRLAENKEKYGHVCPACGETHCEASHDANGHTEYTCASCGTHVTKDILLSKSNPDNSVLRVAWDVTPDLANCKDCKEKAMKFASKIKVEGLLKTASENENSFPMANCMERIARKYGGETVASFGPCKGKLLADCVCSELKKLGFRTVRHMERLASVAQEADPMDSCIEEQKKKGHNIKQATSICKCVKDKVYAELKERDPVMAEAMDNMYLAAYIDDIKSGKEKTVTANDLITLKEVYAEKEAEKLAEIEAEKEKALDVDIGTDLPELKEENKTAMDSRKVKQIISSEIKEASTPKKVENIEGNVEAGVPRSNQTLGKEGPDNIDVPMNKPKVPRGDATQGQESAENINKPANLPDVPVDSSYQGQEQSIQKGMPAINNDIKGTVIAKNDSLKKKAKELKEVDTVEHDVEAGVPRGDATMGEEGKDNIDVDAKKPDVPRGDATMGEEGKDNIDVDEKKPDVPMGDAEMGGEKETQKDLPKNNDEILKNVQQKRDVQLERIAAARESEAVKTTAWLASNGRIADDKETFDSVVKALSGFELSQIAKVAEQMFPAKKQTKTASSSNKEVKQAGHSIPAIVMESKAPEGESLSERLRKQFTIGNKGFDEKLTIYGEK